MKSKSICALVNVLALFFTSCENPIRMETKVHENGTLDKTIVLEKADSVHVEHNYFGVSAAKGWAVSIEEIKSQGDKKQFSIAFQKKFPSAGAYNTELDIESDTLFRVQAVYDKSFRWFYTYLRYSETIRPIDRLKMVRAEDYFTAEDKSFIDRLPGEGIAIPKADSIFLQFLNEKIYDHYANQGLFNEQFAIITEVVNRNIEKKQWLDTLRMHREFIFRKLVDMDEAPDFIINMIDSLGIPIAKEKARIDYFLIAKDLNSRIGFMAFARDGKYTNIIDMPWAIVASNADSIAGNKLYWKPLATKFAIQEYEMFAEARKLNWWAVGVSLLIVGFTVFLLVKEKTFSK